MWTLSAVEPTVLDILRMPPERPGTLEEQVRLLADKEEIRDLICRYGQLCDRREWSDLLDLYTDDIDRVLEGSLAERVQGKEALRHLLEVPVLPQASGAGGARPIEELLANNLKHMMATEVIRVSPDGAEAWAVAYYTMVVTRGSVGADFRHATHEGTYRFYFVKTPDGWRYRRQIVESNSAANPLLSTTR